MARPTLPTDRTVHTIQAEVRYAETDQMGVVHHANYLIWLELARTALCEISGHRYADIEKNGLFLMVTGVSLSYREAARYGDTVHVSCWTERVASRALDFGYRVERVATDDDPPAILAFGSTYHSWVDRDTGRVCRIPAHLEAAFRGLIDIDS